MSKKQLLAINVLMAMSIGGSAAAASTVPTQFQGVWGDDQAACSALKRGLNTDKILTIKSDQIIGYESKCKLEAGDMKGLGFDGKFTCEDDGGKYKASYSLAINAPHKISSSVSTNGKKSPATIMVACAEQSASASPELGNAHAATSDVSANGSVTGSYKFNENDLTVLQLPGGRIKFKVSAMAGSNIGEAEGEIALTDDTAVYKNNDFGKCVIVLKFIANKAVITQDGQCGMGNNVSADGTYKKLNGKVPHIFGGAEGTRAVSNTSVRVNDKPRNAAVVSGTSVGRSQVPAVTCSAEDQVGMVDPKTGQMSQRALDIQMGRVRCR